MNRMIKKPGTALSLVLCSIIALVGCDKPPENKLVDRQSGANKQQGGKTPANTAEPKKDGVTKRPTETIDPPPPIPHMPPVVMSQQHHDKLKVRQNDQLSDQVLDGELIGLDGKSHTLRAELGEKLTIVLFWSADHAYAAEELHYLASHVAHEYGDQGVKIVTVNQLDNQEHASKAAGTAGASSLVTLLDSDKKLDQLADGSVPRTYLLDAQGRVLWLDIVFDRSTRRQLNGAITFVLGKS